MNEKLSFQYMAEALSRKSSVQKKVAESFMRAFFDTIVESVRDGDEVLKIDGLGTFRQVAVDSRESVNVSNGERIVIPGYNKLTFAADDTVIEMLCDRRSDNGQADISIRKKIDMPDELRHRVHESSLSDGESNDDSCEDGTGRHEVSVGSEEAESAGDNDAGNGCGEDCIGQVQGGAESGAPESLGNDGDLSIDDLIEVEEPVCVERANDVFSGIDMLISTPESVDDVRHQLEQATAKVAEAIDMAKKASAEKTRLERLLERLEKNTEPEARSMAGNQLCERTENDGCKHSVDTDDRSEALARVFSEGHSPVQSGSQEGLDDTSDKRKNKKPVMWWLAASCMALLLACIAYFVYKTFVSIESVETVSGAVETVKPSSPNKNAGAADKREKVVADSSAVNASKEVAADAVGTDEVKESTVEKDAKSDAPVAQPPSVVNKASRPSTYVVKKGETLTRISMRLYGTKDSVKAIMRVNTLANPNNVPAGAKIKLP